MRITLLAILLCFNFTYSQTTRTEKLSVVKKRTANLLEIKTDKTFFTEYLTKDKNSTNYYRDYGDPNYSYSLLKEDPNYPDYIASVEFHLKPVKVLVSKEKDSNGKESNTVVYISEIDATLYITDRLKGLMYKENISLKNQNETFSQIIDNVTRFKYSMKKLTSSGYLKSTLVEKEVSDINLKAYFLTDKNGKKIARENRIDKVNEPQIHKLKILAKERLKAAFFRMPYNEYHTFYYIKKFKNYNIEPFNKALSLLKEYVTQQDKDTKKVKEAIGIWKGEIERLDVNERKQKKLYIKGLENIAKAYYIIYDKDACGAYVSKVREANKMDDYMSFYVRKSTDISAKEIDYLPIPKKLYNANRFSEKDPNKINYIPGAKGNGTHLNMILINTLTSKAEQSLYVDKQLFVALNQLALPKQLKKFDEDSYNALRAYKKEVKSLFTKSSGSSEFFKNKSYKELQDNLSSSFDDFLKADLSHLDEDKINLITDLYLYYANVIIVKNNNLMIEDYNILNKSLKPRVGDFIEQSENPRLEIFYEMNSLFENKSSVDNVINFSKKEVQTLRQNIIKFCELVK